MGRGKVGMGGKEEVRDRKGRGGGELEKLDKKGSGMKGRREQRKKWRGGKQGR